VTDGRPRCLLLVAAALTAGACGGHAESTAKQVGPRRCRAVPHAWAGEVGDIGTWAKIGALAVGGGQILSVDSVFA